MEKITIRATVNAPVEKVWDFWGTPEHITKWCSPSDDWHAPNAKNDLKVNGKFSTRMEAKDGSFGFDFAGVYDDVTKHKLIAYTLEDGRQVKITFEEKDGATEVIETFDPESENPIDMQRDGWQAILDSFKVYTEKNS
ncbi:SRPBCC family protein [uncultured Roseivirga sp.]|uniref:SRPBCC family protein n=1 Tax=uncultured Roseivirga sp. TaxID=543088 RepID=UPI0030D8208D|tara:strand:+ start:197 stop:610 length:414 start_codon:yes stop_codon:yes gene_type:complete